MQKLQMVTFGLTWNQHFKMLNQTHTHHVPLDINKKT